VGEAHPTDDINLLGNYIVRHCLRQEGRAAAVGRGSRFELVGEKIRDYL